RGLMHLGWLFFAGVAAMFWIVARRGTGNNYVALKLILGFGWLAYLIAGLALAKLLAWRPKLAPIIGAAMAVLCLGLWNPAVRFTRSLHMTTRNTLFLESDGRASRDLFGPGAHAYVAAGWFNTNIIGQFLAND